MKWLRVRKYNDKGYMKGSDGKYIYWDEDIPEGWKKSFGKQMVEELHEILIKYNYEDRYRIAQIKEKYGGLRWYDFGVSEEMSDEYYKWLEKYELLSEQTCIICGEPATHMTEGWVIPKCDKCGGK